MKSTLLKYFCSCCCIISMAFGSTALKATNHPIQPTAEKNPSAKTTIFQSLLSDDILTVTLTTALDSLTINKKTNNYYPAALSYTNKKGELINRNIELKPRGRSRRNYCDFPPLKVKFSKSELTADGLSKSHKSLKLVTHCNDGANSKQNVLEEYLVYKMYNQLTNNSLKVQLVKIKYIDTNSNKTLNRFGIVIEDIDELADRMDGKEIEGFGLETASFNQSELQTFAMFQYMIGNEDWRLPYMRNVKFVQLNDGGEKIAIPYDFDASGFVHTAYAKPDRDLKLKSVRQRAFMGVFDSKSERAATVALFNAKKQAIFDEILNLKSLDKASKIEAIDYLESFYEIINTSKLLKKVMPVNGATPLVSDVDGEFEQIK